MFQELAMLPCPGHDGFIHAEPFALSWVFRVLSKSFYLCLTSSVDMLAQARKWTARCKMEVGSGTKVMFFGGKKQTAITTMCREQDIYCTSSEKTSWLKMFPAEFLWGAIDVHSPVPFCGRKNDFKNPLQIVLFKSSKTGYVVCRTPGEMSCRAQS